MDPFLGLIMKKNILAIGMWVETSGLSRVTHHVLKSVATDHNVQLIGMGYKGPVHQRDNITVLPCNLNGGDMHGLAQAERLISTKSPDLVFICCDIGLVPKYGRFLQKYRGRIKSILYLAMDGKILDPHCSGLFSSFDHVVTYTRFASDQVRKAYKIASRKRPLEMPHLKVIPHGVDHSSFHQLSEHMKRAAYDKFIGDGRCDQEDNFIVLNANRPHGRKRIDKTIEGFARFAIGKPKGVRLYLHHARTIPRERHQIKHWILKYGVRDRVILNPLGPRSEFLSDTELNELYNICQVGINNSSGEGWGLVSFEHAATGMAQIVPDHSACTEIWKGAAHLLPAYEETPFPTCNLMMQEVDPGDIAQALEKVYSDAGYRNSLAAKGQALVTEAKYQWENIEDEWRQFFAGVITIETPVVSRTDATSRLSLTK